MNFLRSYTHHNESPRTTGSNVDGLESTLISLGISSVSDHDQHAERFHPVPCNSNKNSCRGRLSNRPVEMIYGEISAEIALDLDMMHLDIILRNIIPKFSSDQKLIQQAHSISYRVGAVKKPVGKRIGGVSLDDIAVVMEKWIHHDDSTTTTFDLPSTVVAYVHTYIGLIRQQQENFDGAIRSFIKALWIRLASKQAAEFIAVAAYRLAMAYVLNDDNENAIVALKQSIQYFSQSSTISMDHEFVIAAKKCLSDIGITPTPRGGGDEKSKSEQLLLKKSRFDRDEETVTTSDMSEATGRRSLSQW